MAWQTMRACKGSDPELFFSTTYVGQKAAKAICAQCAVSKKCLEMAMEERIDYGIFGGKTGSQRGRIRTERRRKEREKQNAHILVAGKR